MSDKSKDKELSFAERLKLKKEADAAKKRGQRIQAAVSKATETGDTTAISNFLRKGEEIAFIDKLRPYQVEAVLQTVRNKRTGTHTLNASDVGIGKTRVAASFVNTIKEFKRVLWLTSVTLVTPTCREIASLGGTVVPVGDKYGVFRQIPFENTVIFVTNYEKLRVDPNLMLPGEFDCIIYDEVTKLKGGAAPASQRTLNWKLAKELLHECNPEAYRLFLSGTPAVNHPKEIWAYLHLFDPVKFADFWRFERMFCVYKEDGSLLFSTERLLEILQGCVIRQTVSSLKLEGVANLDDPTWFNEEIIPISVDPNSSVGTHYLSMARAAIAEFDGTALTPNMQLEVILRLRQLLLAGGDFTFKKIYPTDTPGRFFRQEQTVHIDGPYPKLDAAVELIARYQSEGEQVVVFSCFNQPLKNLQKHINPPDMPEVYSTAMLTGETPQDQRGDIIKNFQDGKIDVLLINKLAGAEGINLQKCDAWPGGARVAVHLDTWWNPAKERQANGRIVRMNTNVPCIAYYLEVQNSVDEYMRSIINQKKEDIGQLDMGILRDSLERGTLG